MPKFAANLSTMFLEHPFADRFRAAADCGFSAVECQFPYEISPDALAAALDETGLDLVLFNLPAGDWATGERGIAAIPGREAEVDTGFAKALDYVQASGCTHLHILAGSAPKVTRTAAWATFESNLRRLLLRAEAAGITLLLEPINSRDMPNYILTRTEEATSLIERIDSPNLRLQLDLYHRQIMQGDLIRGIDDALPLLAHVQIAGVPDRHEPNVGEINYAAVFRHLDTIGYEGWVGCEYLPAGDTRDGLGWMEGWR